MSTYFAVSEEVGSFHQSMNGVIKECGQVLKLESWRYFVSSGDETLQFLVNRLVVYTEEALARLLRLQSAVLAAVEHHGIDDARGYEDEQPEQSPELAVEEGESQDDAENAREPVGLVPDLLIRVGPGNADAAPPVSPDFYEGEKYTYGNAENTDEVERMLECGDDFRHRGPTCRSLSCRPAGWSSAR